MMVNQDHPLPHHHLSSLLAAADERAALLPHQFVESAGVSGWLPSILHHLLRSKRV